MKRYKRGFRAVAAWLQLLAGCSMLAQEFRIDQVRFAADGRIEVLFPSQPGRYYRLLAGTRPDAVTEPVAVGLQGPLQAADPASASAGFFRVQEVERTAAVDSDGDGRDDLDELLAGTNPLTQDKPPANVTTISSSPANGEGEVSVTRETVLRFSRPVAEGTALSSQIVSASFGQRRLLTRVELVSDRRSATLFYLEPLPGSARIRVTIDGNAILDAQGKAVDADGDGEPGGLGLIDFNTLSVTPVGVTAVVGRVFASELVDGKSVNQPLEGVTITVDGAEETLRTVTDAQGNFRLQPSPAGTFFVHVDGRTAKGSSWPDGAYYPFVGKAWEAVAGRVDNLASGTGEVFLPLVRAGTLKSVSPTVPTKIEFPAEVVAANPALAGVSLQVPPNALYSDGGVRGGRVGIAPVAPDRLPEPLPAGLNFPLVITVQTDGGSNFSEPVPVVFPNLPDPVTGKKLPPGAKSALWGFDHDLGTWVINGPMTVSADGKFIVSDPGVGIREPGWHGTQPGCSASGAHIDARCDPTGCLMGPIRVINHGGGSFSFEADPSEHSPGIMNWYIPDGRNAQGFSGNFITVQFCDPGTHTILAELSPKCGDPCSKSFTVEVRAEDLDCKIHSVDQVLPSTAPVKQGERVQLMANLAMPPARVVWEIQGGRAVEGQHLDVSEGSAQIQGSQASIDLAFCEPGLKKVKVRCFTQCGQQCEKTIQVEVEARNPEVEFFDIITGNGSPPAPSAGDAVIFKLRLKHRSRAH